MYSMHNDLVTTVETRHTQITTCVSPGMICYEVVYVYLLTLSMF